MEFSSTLTQILTDLALQLPSAITIVVCMVVVIFRRKRHPAVAAWALIGLILILIHGHIFVFIYALVPQLLLRNLSTAEFTSAVTVLGAVFNITKALAFAPLLAAIFIKRPKPQST